MLPPIKPCLFQLLLTTVKKERPLFARHFIILALFVLGIFSLNSLANAHETETKTPKAKQKQKSPISLKPTIETSPAKTPPKKIKATSKDQFSIKITGKSCTILGKKIPYTVETGRLPVQVGSSKSKPFLRCLHT